MRNKDIIEPAVNKCYGSAKILNFYIICALYMLAAIGMDIVNNFSGSKSSEIIVFLSISFVLVQLVSLTLCIVQFRYFKKIIYPLLTAPRSDKEYIEDILKYRKTTYIYLSAQVLIGLLLLFWFILTGMKPESVLLYPIPKLSIVVIFGYILGFLSIDSDLDSIYWKYFKLEYRKYIDVVFKKN